MDMNEVDRLSNRIIGAALEVHKALGPGLLESVYQKSLSYELHGQGIKHTIEQPVPVKYKGTKIECAFRADLIAEDSIIVEIKSVEKLLPIHEAQLITYLRLTGIRLGLLINFNTKLLKDGIKRIIL
jgi:GxxExxY protein